LEAGTTQNWSALRRLEGDSGFCAAFRTMGSGLGANALATSAARAFCFAGFASLRIVFELLVVKEKLLASSKNEFLAAIDTLQYTICELHGRHPQNRDLQ